MSLCIKLSIVNIVIVDRGGGECFYVHVLSVSILATLLYFRFLHVLSVSTYTFVFSQTEHVTVLYGKQLPDYPDFYKRTRFCNSHEGNSNSTISYVEKGTPETYA